MFEVLHLLKLKDQDIGKPMERDHTTFVSDHVKSFIMRSWRFVFLSRLDSENLSLDL
jgi:hypothetical protein